MTTFILSETPGTQLKSRFCKGRLILDELSHGMQVEVIDAPDWKSARAKVNNLNYEHQRNSGWFMPEQEKVPA